MKSRIPLNRALNIAQRFLKELEGCCEKMVIAGSIRRMKSEVGDIEIVCTRKAEDPEALERKFHKDYPGIVVNGSRLKRFKYPKSGIQIELYIAQPYDYGRILAIRTGSSAFSHYVLATTWNRIGWCGTADGLRRKAECDHRAGGWKIKETYKDNPTLPPVFTTEEEFFKFLGIPYVHPSKRSWISKNDEHNYAP